MCQIRPKPITVASPISTVKPSIAEKAARYKKQENDAPFFQVRTARANPRNRKYSISLRDLARDDVLQLSLHHHKVDELDLRHLSAPRAGATVGAQCSSSAKTNPAQFPDTPTHARCRRPSQCTHPGSKATPTCSEAFDERSAWMD